MQPDSQIQHGKHIPQLDGLRGIAILLVMCYHYFPNIKLFHFGWTGVDLFFVLSGFLISGRLLPYLGERKILLKFYRNRFLRIVPLYFCFLAIFFGGWFFFSSDETLKAFPFYTSHWWSFFLFFQNWIFANNTQSVMYLQHLWSVAVEEQIYLFFPLLAVLIRNKTRMLYMILTIMALILLFRWYHYHFIILPEEYLKIFNNTFLRLDSFLAGVCIYLIQKDQLCFNRVLRSLTPVMLSCIITLVLYIFISGDAEKNNSFISTFGYTVIAFLYACLLVGVLSKKYKIINSITSFAFLRFTGKISYGIYIFHWPLFLCGFILLNKIFAGLNYIPGEDLLLLCNVLICFPATYILSTLSYRYFESFFLKRKAITN